MYRYFGKLREKSDFYCVVSLQALFRPSLRTGAPSPEGKAYLRSLTQQYPPLPACFLLEFPACFLLEFPLTILPSFGYNIS